VLDKLTRVGPPQTDPMIQNQRNEKQNDLGSKNLKSDFKTNLKEQIKKDQLKADQKTDHQMLNGKKSQPGENKKKVAKNASKQNSEEPDTEEKQIDIINDPKIISINMVSNESEIEIPDVENNLAMIQESNNSSNLFQLQLEDQSSGLQDISQAELFEIEPTVGKLSEQFISESEPILESVPQSKEQLFIDNSTKERPAMATQSAFQEKVMDVLKKENFDKPDLNFDQLKEQLNEKNSVVKNELSLVAANSKSELQTNLNSDSESTNQDPSSKESSLHKEDFIKSELSKMDSLHVGQSEFHTQLSTTSHHDAKGIDSLVKTDASADPSVKELLSQANYLVTQGGGEVTLKMNSADGIGDVHLKVMMDNGKMSIELNTQDKSAKKLIEDSLSDLRSSLAARQISLEHVKINSVKAMNTENSTQFSQSHSNGSGADSNQSKTFAELQQQHSNGQHQKQQRNFQQSLLNDHRPVMLPMKNAQRTAASQYYGLNKAQTLNAVA
jgi:hypothetical protein